MLVDHISVPLGPPAAPSASTVHPRTASLSLPQDPRYNDEVDRITGYRTDTLLCMPVRNYYGEIIAVAQVVNKCPDEMDGNFTYFMPKDERIFETYLQFVGIAITNAQLMEVSQSEYERNRSLLEVVHDLFEEQTSLENVILKTLQRAQRLLKCERAAVLLLEDGSEEDQGGPRATPVRHKVVVRGQAPPPPPHSQRRFSRTSLTRHSSRANNKARSLPSRAIETSTPHATPPTTPPVPSPSPQDTVTPNTAAAGKVTTRQHGRSASGLLPRLYDIKKQSVKFSKIFELNSPVSGQQSNNAKEVGSSELTKHLLHLAEQVASSGENLNIADTIEVEKGSGGNVRSMLAMPIRNRNFQIIGVAKIINKLNGQPFDDNDEQLFEAFTIFCGLGINNTLMYNELEKAMARQKVAIEVLSYHATASAEDVESLQREVVPEASTWSLGSLTFDDFSLTQDQMLLAAMRMFMDLRLVHRFKIESKVSFSIVQTEYMIPRPQIEFKSQYRVQGEGQTLLRWLITVKRNYRNVPYHNWRHAFNVAHNMFCLLKTCGLQSTFEDIEWLGMFVGCLCHDLDHRGTNNSFQENSGLLRSSLWGRERRLDTRTESSLLGASFRTHLLGFERVVEAKKHTNGAHHNKLIAVMILNSEGHNIFSNLSSSQYSRVMNVLKLSILATDLSIYFQVRSKFFPLVANGEFDTDQKEHRDILRSLLMTACDIAASTKPWDTQLKVAKLVTSEFFDQGDLEKSKLKITPPALMDRDRKHELPLLQMRWIKDICLPLFDGLAQVNPKMAPMRDGALRNMTRWAKLAASQENGLSDLQEPPDIPRVPDG
ncbi:dual 3',5'-cyclic-AMP and -GMP phosphodiesterase 11A-like [Penaeus chinensis]|uniref:dual 3',5'-cyclic-AMP and -GMP phosphodiesterase 11A-like n=1 Tax=Penaeus chinensis TaxID=139456 RepID=UPI001FB6C8E2|nr:dual 3',5'-cyclic-AMP and -GMP phosphodiesterase 11A-like [Penaeus chinensis]